MSYLCIAGNLLAQDSVETTNGATLIGEISSFDEQTIILLTEYAGELKIERKMVKSFSSTEPRFVRLQSGTTISGTVSSLPDGKLEVAGIDATLSTTLDKIVASWQPEQTDPEIRRLELERQALERSWEFKAGVDIAGRSGNSDELSTDANLEAKLVGPNDALRLYGSVERAERDGDDTSDEVIVGADYTSYFSEPWGWFVRGEVERDEFESLDLRTSLGAGVSYRFLNRPTHSLSLRGGAGYRFESFNDGTNEDSPTLDLGLDHKWQFAEWGRVTSLVTFSPAVDDFADFLLVQDSGIEMPLGLNDKWILRLGVKNDFKNRPAEGSKKLDTSYYSRMQLSWR